MDLDRARHGFGPVSPETAITRSPACGDEVRVEATFSREPDTIAAVTWTGRGCTVSMASASALAAVAPGLTLSEFTALKAEFEALVRGPLPADELPDADSPLGAAAAFAGIGRLPLRATCAMLAWTALERAAETSLPTPPSQTAHDARPLE